MPKRELVGRVTSDRMSKTRVVEIPRKVKHPKYGKYVHRKTVCYVHDEENSSKEGDLVKIIESRPLSRTKRWNLVEVVIKIDQINIAAARADAAVTADVETKE